jgi:D-alanyl-D-alanine carboxypeptidase (penicillin-binding protein 5/6)
VIGASPPGPADHAPPLTGACPPGPADHAPPVPRARLAAGVLAAVVALAFPATASARDCPESVKAPNAIVLETSTGDVACARRADARRPVGSAVKLMTALLTLERADLDETFTASDYRPASFESQIGLLPRERMTVRDLLQGLLAESGNDAAMTLAEGVAGSERAFVRRMNRRARELELTNTHYRNPIGLDEPGAYSSARDLVKLATFLRTKAFFRRTVNSPVVQLTSGDHPRKLENRNGLVASVDWINGVKTGHTRGAGYVLVGSGRKNGIQVVSAVLGTPSEAARDADTLRLLTFGRRAFQRITAAPSGSSVGVSVPIRYRRGAELELVVGPNGQRTVVRRGDRDSVTVVPTSYPSEVQGPIAYGEELGEADVLQDGRKIATVALVAGTEVPKADLAQRTKSWFTRPLAVVLAFAVLSGTVLLARRRRRPRGPGPRRAREEARTA